MSHHHASVRWQHTGPGFTERRYSRCHTWHFDGGGTVAASASPHVVPPPWVDAAAVDPEEAFVASLASCHMLWFLDVASRAGWSVSDYRDDAVGTLARNAEGALAITTVTLRPAVRFVGERGPDFGELQRLHHEAHTACFVAASVKSEVRCEPVWLDEPATP